MIRYASIVASMALAAPALAGEAPLYAPAPAWVKPAAPIDATRLDATSPIMVLYDNQQRLQDGEVWGYVDTATRIASAEVLSQAGTLGVSWQPSKGDLIVHRVQILRGAQTIDVLAGGKRFTIIRREQKLEQREINGVLTATLPVEGLQIGDVLRMAISITQKDAALGGQVQTSAPLPVAPFRVGNTRTRLIWPEREPVQWKTYAEGAKPVVTTAGGYRELLFDGVLPKQPELPNDAPPRFARPPFVEASSFADWAAVSKVMAPLYATDGLIAPGGPLAAEVARITAAESDPLKRAARALALVQGQVRYLYNGMAGGNYTPQKPADTWSLRYGDCKAKTLLLLSLLRAMGIESEAVIAPAEAGDLLDGRLPMPGAFDHVIVRATIAGDTLWLDGTASGATLADIRDVPGFRRVLPIRAAGAAIMPVPFRADARPDGDVTIDYDQRAGVSLPTLVSVTMKFRGQAGAMLDLAASQATPDQKRDMIQGLVGKVVPDARLTDQAIAYDAATGIGTVTASGLVSSAWAKDRGRYRAPLDHVVGEVTFQPDRIRPAWRAIPVSTGASQHLVYHTRLRLPQGGAGFALDGDQKLDEVIAGRHVIRSVALAGDLITVDEEVASVAPEIAPEAVSAARARIALAGARLLQAVAPADLPSRFAVAAARKSGALKPILAAYDRSIANDPDDKEVYLNRARFLAGVYDQPAAIPDLTKAIAIEPDVGTYLWRASLYELAGDRVKQRADLDEAMKLDPSAFPVIAAMAEYRMDRGEKEPALALVQERVDVGGKDAPGYMALKADLLAKAGARDEALATIDAAVTASPGNAQLLNSRCWIKGTLNVQLDTALKDCTRAIELSDSRIAALDSRAMVYFRLNRYEEAMADLAAALDDAPDQAGSLYLRGIIRGKQGAGADAKADVASARLISPLIDREYGRFGIQP